MFFLDILIIRYLTVKKRLQPFTNDYYNFIKNNMISFTIIYENTR